MESDAHFDYKASIDNWADKYEAAQKAGVFKDADAAAKLHTPSSQVMNNGFFGHQQGDTTDDVSDADANYWNQVAMRADKNSFQPEIMTEQKSVDKVISEAKLDSAGLKAVQQKFNQVLNSANPIKPSTAGPDHGPVASGETYSPEDIEELITLKTKLEELQGQLIPVLDNNKKAKPLEAKIKALQEKIEELSDGINNGFVLSQS